MKGYADFALAIFLSFGIVVNGADRNRVQPIRDRVTLLNPAEVNSAKKVKALHIAEQRSTEESHAKAEQKRKAVSSTKWPKPCKYLEHNQKQQKTTHNKRACVCGKLVKSAASAVS